MNSCELMAAISALAASIANGKTVEELSLLSVFFTQLGDSLDTIAVGRELCLNGTAAKKGTPRAMAPADGKTGTA